MKSTVQVKETVEQLEDARFRSQTFIELAENFSGGSYDLANLYFNRVFKDRSNLIKSDSSKTVITQILRSCDYANPENLKAIADIVSQIDFDYILDPLNYQNILKQIRNCYAEQIIDLASKVNLHLEAKKINYNFLTVKSAVAFHDLCLNRKPGLDFKELKQLHRNKNSGCQNLLEVIDAFYRPDKTFLKSNKSSGLLSFQSEYQKYQTKQVDDLNQIFWYQIPIKTEDMVQLLPLLKVIKVYQLLCWLFDRSVMPIAVFHVQADNLYHLMMFDFLNSWVKHCRQE